MNGIYGQPPTQVMPPMGQPPAHLFVPPGGQPPVAMVAPDFGQPPAPAPGGLRLDERGGDANYRRNEVISRVVSFNRRHATKAWETRRSQPACPHGVAFLYREPGIGGTPFDRVRAATAMFDADDDSTALRRLLDRLIDVAEAHRARGRFDPATQMAIHRDEPDARDTAVLFGIAVSTLDTQAATWAEQQRSANDENDLGGRCLILLAEKPPIHHGFIVVERGAPRAVRFDLTIRSTVDLNFHLGMAARPWQPVQTMAELPVADEVWKSMYSLHLLAFEQNPRPTL